MKTCSRSIVSLFTLCLLLLIPLRGAQAVAIAETRLEFLWDTFTVTGGVEGVDYAWSDSRIYYGAHSESQQNSGAESDTQSNSVNPLNDAEPDSVLTTSGWASYTHGSAYLTQDDGSGRELSRSTGYAYSDNAGVSFANGNTHRGRNLYVYTATELTFSIDFLIEQTFQVDALGLEHASGFSRPDIYLRDDYNNLPSVAETYLEFYHDLADDAYSLAFSHSGTLSLTTELALNNTGSDYYEGAGVYWFEGHAHTSASVSSAYEPAVNVPEPSTLSLFVMGLLLLVAQRGRVLSRA